MFLRKINIPLIAFFICINSFASSSLFYFNPELTMRLEGADFPINKKSLTELIKKNDLKKELDNFLGIDSTLLLTSKSNSKNITYFDYKNISNVKKISRLKALINIKFSDCRSSDTNDSLETYNAVFMENQFIIASENLKNGKNNTESIKIFLNDLGYNTDKSANIYEKKAIDKIHDTVDFINLKRVYEHRKLSNAEALRVVNYLNGVKYNFDEIGKYVASDKQHHMKNFIKLNDEDKIKLLNGTRDLPTTVTQIAGFVVTSAIAYHATKSIFGKICGDTKVDEFDDFDGPKLPGNYPPIKDPSLEPQRPPKGL